MTDFAPFEQIRLGDVRITYLPDGGGVADPMATFPTSTEVDWSMFGAHLDADQQLRTTIGGFLVEAGDRRIAVDTGIGPVRLEFEGVGTYFGGAYLDSLALSGVAPDEVTDVVFTHLHLDHVGWTTRETEDVRRVLTFPNARHWVSEAEWQHWHGGDDPTGPHPEHVQAFLEHRLSFLDDADELAPGVSAIAAPGHTPGHLALRVRVGDACAVLMGDVMYAAIQVAQLEWPAAFDLDPAQAEASRRAIVHEVNQPNVIGCAGHFTDSVFGQLVGTGLGLVWRPLRHEAE